MSVSFEPWESRVETFMLNAWGKWTSILMEYKGRTLAMSRIHNNLGGVSLFVGLEPSSLN